MGGFGSGRPEYAPTATVGESHTLAVDELTDVLDEYADRDVVDRDGEGFMRYRWRDDHGHGEEVAAIGIYVARDGRPAFGGGAGDRSDVEDALAGRPTHLRLQYTVTPRGGEGTEHEYRVDLEYTACNYGGVRPWFRCPGVECGERVGKLHRPPGGDVFACRECHGLGYQSSRRSGDAMKQAELRFRRCHEKIDGRRKHPGQYLVPPDRPTGMHRDTYQDLVDDLEDAYREWEDASRDRLRALVDRTDVEQVVERLLEVAEYDEKRRELSSKRVRRNVLRAEKSSRELDDSERYQRIQREIADLEDELDEYENREKPGPKVRI